MEPNLAFQTSNEETPLPFKPCRPDRYDVTLDFAPFIDITKLIGSENYDSWHQSICTVFQAQGVWDLVTGSEQPLLSLNPPFSQDYQNWRRLDKSLCALLGMTVERAILVDVPENLSIDAMYDFLQTNHQPKPGPDFSHLLKTLTRLRRENFPTAVDYTHKFMTVYHEMETARPNGISAAVVNTLFLDGLGDEWADFRERIMESKVSLDSHTPGELFLMVSEAEEEREFLEEEAGIATEPTQPVRKQRGRPFCGHCNMIGHHQEGCWRIEGRSEEEIKIIRRTLREDRSSRRRKSGGPLARRVSSSRAGRRASGRISKR